MPAGSITMPVLLKLQCVDKIIEKHVNMLFGIFFLLFRFVFTSFYQTRSIFRSKFQCEAAMKIFHRFEISPGIRVRAARMPIVPKKLYVGGVDSGGSGASAAV